MGLGAGAEVQGNSLNSVLNFCVNLKLPQTVLLSSETEITASYDHLTCLLRNLYAGQEAAVRTGHGTTDWFQIGKGVRQGCTLSPAYLTSMQSTS